MSVMSVTSVISVMSVMSAMSAVRIEEFDKVEFTVEWNPCLFESRGLFEGHELKIMNFLRDHVLFERYELFDRYELFESKFESRIVTSKQFQLDTNE